MPSVPALEELLKEADAQTGGPAAEALGRAAQLTREAGDLIGAIDLYERAWEAAEAETTAPRLRATLALELGELYEAELGRVDRAQTLYDRACEVAPGHLPALEAARRLARALGDWQKVKQLDELELQSASDPQRRVQLLTELGRTLADQLREPEQAAARLEEAVKLDSKAEPAKEHLAELYVSLGLAAGQHDERLTRSAQHFFELSEAQAARGDLAGQVASLRRALGADPTHVAAAARLEEAYLAGQQTEELHRLYRQGVPVPARATKLACAALDSGDLDEAIAALLAAEAAGEAPTAAITRLQAELTQQKRWAQLASLRDQLLGERVGRDRADALVESAADWQRAGEAERFEAALLEALAADPTHATALQQLEEHLTQKRDYATLAGVLEQAVAALPPKERPARLAALAELYEKKLSDVTMALDAWQRACTLTPSAHGSAELKRLGLKQERWDSMTAALERELAAASGREARTEALKRLGQIYRERHDFERARAMWQEALELSPQDAASYRGLAELFEREGKLPEMAEILRKQLGIAKEKVERLNLLRRLAALYDERLDDLSGIEWACGEILEQLPGDRDALRRLEAAYERAGAPAEARLRKTLEQHAQAAATPTEKVPLLWRLAKLHEEQSELACAVELLERVVKLDKHHIAAWEALGRLYERMERWAEAALALERTLPGVPVGPEGAEPWRRYGRIVDLQLGDAMRAARAWREVLARRPTDKDALDGLARLARTRGDWAQLDEILARRQAHATGEAAIELALERAQLADERLQRPADAIALLRQLLERAPRHLEAHARLQKLLVAQGDVEGGLRVAERELFLCQDPARRREIAVEIARRCGQLATAAKPALDRRWAIAAWRRVLDLAPGEPEALAALAEHYAQLGDWRALLRTDEARLERSELPPAEAVPILLELAHTAEEKLGEAAAAFAYLRRAHELVPDERTLAELRRLAKQHGLWEELCAVYATLPGLEARLRVAEIAHEELGDPKRAFAVVRGALDLDPRGERVLPELERLSVPAEEASGLLEVYEQLIPRSSTAQKVDLLRRRANVRETRLQDAGGALDELVRAFPLAPEDPSLLAEVHRLAELTGRWDDALAVEGYRFHRAPERDRLAIACEAAALVETKVADPLRAFRAYLRAFQLAPQDETVRAHLWRLAKQVGEIGEEPPAPPPLRMSIPPAPPALALAGGLVIESRAPAREPTQEVSLDEVMFDDSKPIAVRRDPTVELSINDLLTIARPAVPEQGESNGRAKKANGKNGASHRTAPAVPISRPPALSGPHSAWEELALVQLSLPARDAEERFANLLSVSEMWERGAADLGRAFATLAGYFRLDPAHAATRAALERLAEEHGAWDQLIAVLDETLAEAGHPETAVRLLVDSAQVRERQGDLDDAERRYHRALGMRPDDEEVLTRLEEVYRAAQRWQDLANLLERRLHGLIERMPTSAARQKRALELAELYERMGNTYEAIDAWTHVTREYPAATTAFASLARLYEAVGQWSKVIEALTRQLDLVDATGGVVEARQIRRRIGEIFERELELPERALEAYATLFEADPSDAATAQALERLYEKLGQFGELEVLLKRLAERAEGDEAIALHRRRARLLSERLGDPAGAAAVWRRLHKLCPDDDEVAAQLEAELGKAGLRDEQAEVLRQRLRAAKRQGLGAAELTRLHVELGVVEAALGDREAAERTLVAALELSPDDPRALAELARLRQGGADWDGYAAAREREAEVAPTPALAIAALVDAARVHMDRRRDDEAAGRVLQRALQRDPDAIEAVALYGSLTRRLGDDSRADELAHQELAANPTPARQAELYAALGGSALRRDAREEAGRHFRDAAAAQPGYPAAIQGLADLAAHAGAWDEVEALLREAAAREGVPPAVAAQFHRRLAEAAEQKGRLDEAYQALLAADRLQPGDLSTRLRLGENRYHARRFREAAQYLGGLADHPDAARLPKETAEALYHAALAEQKLRRPERAPSLLQAAVRLDPGHAASLGLLAERALEAGEVARGAELLEAQATATQASAERAARFEHLGDLCRTELADPGRAAAAYEEALAAAGAHASEELLGKTLELQRAAGKLQAAAQTAACLLDRPAPPEVQAKRLREAAALDAALGQHELARERLQQALTLDPQEHEALAGLSALLVQEGKDEEAAQLLTRALPLLSAPAPSSRAERATLWVRLGEVRERRRDARGAILAFEKALELDPSRRPLRESLLARYGDDPQHDAAVRAHRMVLVADEPLHVPSLRALYRIEARGGAPDGGRRFLELLAIADALTEEERRVLEAASPPGVEAAEGQGACDESDHQLLAHPDALPLAEVFAALWEGTAAERAPGLEALGVGPEDRISPVAATPLARAYSTVARLLGNRKTGLYLKSDRSFSEVALVAQPPTAIVVGPALVEGDATELRFRLGRALEIARPEYVLAAALPQAEFTQLFAAILKAFHPRHARRRAGEEDEAQRWKRALPYKVAKRLAELFRALADTEFSSARWRQAVRRTGNRAGALAAGQVMAAARVLRAEGDREDLEDLLRFVISDDYLALRTKLDATGRR